MKNENIEIKFFLIFFNCEKGNTGCTTPGVAMQKRTRFCRCYDFKATTNQLLREDYGDGFYDF